MHYFLNIPGNFKSANPAPCSLLPPLFVFFTGKDPLLNFGQLKEKSPLKKQKICCIKALRSLFTERREGVITKDTEYKSVQNKL